MGNAQSRTLGFGLCFVAYSLSSLITLVCLFGIPRAQVFLQVHAQAPAPTIALGTTSANMGTTGSFGKLFNARLDASGTKVLLRDLDSGPIVGEAAPYAFLRRATGFGSGECSFDGTEVSAESSARVYCRAYGNGGDSNYFYVFKFSDLSIIQGSGSANPLVVGSTTLSAIGMVEFVSGTDYLFIASGSNDGTIYRVDTSSFTYSGAVSSTVTATDSTSEVYYWGACDSGTYCYVASDNFKVSRFLQGNSSVDTAYDSTIDLNSNDRLSEGAGPGLVRLGIPGAVIDPDANNLFVASTGGDLIVCKIALSTFTFSSRVLLIEGTNEASTLSQINLCRNCFLSENEYMMILQAHNKKTSFIRVSDMTEVTESSASVSKFSTLPLTAWLSQSSNSGGIVTEGNTVLSLSITNPTTSSTTTASPSNSNNATESDSTNVVIIAVSSSVGGLALIGGIFFIIYIIHKKKEEEEVEEEVADGKKEPADSSELKEVVSNEPHAQNNDEDTAAAGATKNDASKPSGPETNTTNSAAVITSDSSNVSASTPASQKTLINERDSDNAAAITVSVNAPPPVRCFKFGVPDKDLRDSVHALFSIKEAPSNRPDLKNWIPDKNDADDLLHYLDCALPELKNRPAIQKLIAECGLTDDDIKVLHSYKIQNPYPVYLWLNGWLGGDRRDNFVKQHVAPLFVLLYRAMEKLPRIKAVAHRAIKVNNIPSLKNTYDDHAKICAPGQILSFWGFSSFCTESDVINREEFVGKPEEEAIIYSCGELEGVDMEPFAPKGFKHESEILPLCPCVLKVAHSVKVGQKLVISVTSMDHINFAYVAPKNK